MEYDVVCELWKSTAAFTVLRILAYGWFVEKQNRHWKLWFSIQTAIFHANLFVNVDIRNITYVRHHTIIRHRVGYKYTNIFLLWTQKDNHVASRSKSVRPFHLTSLLRWPNRQKLMDHPKRSWLYRRVVGSEIRPLIYKTYWKVSSQKIRDVWSKKDG